MAKYSIRELEALSGVKAHTIRVWEKRYGLIDPLRTSGNIRTYNDRDLRRLLNISILYRKGLKISRIARMSEEELNRKVNDHFNGAQDPGNIIDKLVDEMIRMDEEAFEQTFQQSLFERGFESTITRIIYPFFEKIGILWLTGTIHPAQEHFISNLLRQKMIVAINDLHVVPSFNQKHFLLYLPEEEHHELGLLFYSYLIKKHGHHVLYMGQGVGLNELTAVASQKPVDYILTILSANIETQKLRSYTEGLSKACIRQKIYLTGYQTSSINWDLPGNMHLLRSVDHFHQEMNRILKEK